MLQSFRIGHVVVAFVVCLSAIAAGGMADVVQPIRVKAGVLSCDVPAGWTIPPDAAAAAALEGTRKMVATQAENYKASATGQYPDVGLKDFNVLQSPNGQVYLTVYSMNIPPQPNYYDLALGEVQQMIDDSREQKMLESVSSNGRVTISGLEAIKMDVALTNKMRSAQVSFWTVDVPHQVSIVEVALNPDATEEDRQATDRVLSSVAVVDQAPGKKVGGLMLELPNTWSELDADATKEKRQQYATGMADELKSYARDGEREPRLVDFKIFQDDTGIAIDAWSIALPDQTDLLQGLYDKQSVAMKEPMAQIQSTSCRRGTVNGADVVRIDVETTQGMKSITIFHWTASNPGLITVMITNIESTASPTGAAEVAAILNSITVAPAGE